MKKIFIIDVFSCDEYRSTRPRLRSNVSAFSRRRWTPSGPRLRLLVRDDRSVSLPSEMHWLVTRRLKSKGDANQYPAPGVPFMMLQGEKKQSKRGGKSKINKTHGKNDIFSWCFPTRSKYKQIMAKISYLGHLNQNQMKKKKVGDEGDSR